MDPFTVSLGVAAIIAGAASGLLFYSVRLENNERRREVAAGVADEQRRLEAPHRPLVEAILASIEARPERWTYLRETAEHAPHLHNPEDHVLVGFFCGVTARAHCIKHPVGFALTDKEGRAIADTWERVQALRLLDSSGGQA